MSFLETTFETTFIVNFQSLEIISKKEIAFHFTGYRIYENEINSYSRVLLVMNCG